MAAARRQTPMAPALVASAIVHVAIVAAAVISWPWLKTDMQFGKVVPVTLIPSNTPAEMAPAVQAPEPAPAMAPEPTPQAPAQPAPISSAPPTPPAAPSAAKAADKAKAATSKPAPSTKPAPSAAQAKADKGLDLDALMASLNAPGATPSAQQTSGLQGANRPRADLRAQTGHGADNTMSSDETAAFVGKLEKLWNPNCQVEGAAGINVKVHIRLTPQGWLAAPPDLPDRADIQSSGNPILIASAQRALSAVNRGAPYTELNPEHYSSWRDMNVTFVAKKACAQR